MQSMVCVCVRGVYRVCAPLEVVVVVCGGAVDTDAEA